MTPDVETRWKIGRFTVAGWAALALLVLGLGGWAVSSTIAGAIIAPGGLEVEGNRQIVQHPTGGVIRAIHARDGDEVIEGEVLISLEGQELRSELGIVEGQWFEILARKARLSAERDGLDKPEFDPELTERAAESPAIAAMMAAQEQQFEARLKLHREETQQLEERQTQIAKQIEGLISLQSATKSQIELLGQEIEGQETLLSQGLTQITRVLTPQRELAGLRGNEGQVEATIAENRGRIVEIEIERVRLESELREAAIGELRDLEYREIELRERRRSLIDQIEKLQLRAPVSGVVYGSTADTLRGVIRAAEPVMYVVPRDTPLIVRTQIEPIHIDQVTLGQEATLRFSAFDMRTTPEVTGHVTSISADALEDEQRGIRYYRADIRLDDGAREKLGDLKLLPGMPVEAYIRTSDRTPLHYLTKPLTDYFNRAFREG